MIALDAIQPTYDVPNLAGLQDEEKDAPIEGFRLITSASGIPPLVFGAASLSAQYNTDDHLHSDVPYRTVRLALRYGIAAFDTSAYYGASEIVLGSILRALAPEFPRSTYKLMSKCGRYGADKENFDYSPGTIRKSLLRSLTRLGTSYLDILYLHDVEFVASPVHPADPTGDPSTALDTDEGKEEWGLREEDEGKSFGEGDEKILAAYSELLKLKEEGLVRAIGITGYPLPTLLRLALLIRHRHKPLDALLSYSNYTLQNSAFAQFAPHFASRAEIGQLFTASPLNMGFLTPRIPPWSPAPPGMRQAKARADELCASHKWLGGLPNLALGYALRRGAGAPISQSQNIPTIIGFSGLDEVHEAIRVFREVDGGGVESVSEVQNSNRLSLESNVVSCFADSGWANWAWASPSQ